MKVAIVSYFRSAVKLAYNGIPRELNSFPFLTGF
jgi:hypothetical protein